jgi:hypothetical protein
MAGLVPAIHVFPPRAVFAWMPGTRPGMTAMGVYQAVGTKNAGEMASPA